MISTAAAAAEIVPSIYTGASVTITIVTIICSSNQWLLEMKWSGIIIAIVVSHFRCVDLFIVGLLGRGCLALCLGSILRVLMLVSSLLCLHRRNLSIGPDFCCYPNNNRDNGDDE